SRHHSPELKEFYTFFYSGLLNSSRLSLRSRTRWAEGASTFISHYDTDLVIHTLYARSPDSSHFILHGLNDLRNVAGAQYFRRSIEQKHGEDFLVLSNENTLSVDNLLQD